MGATERSATQTPGGAGEEPRCEVKEVFARATRPHRYDDDTFASRRSDVESSRIQKK